MKTGARPEKDCRMRTVMLHSNVSQTICGYNFRGQLVVTLSSGAGRKVESDKYPTA